MAKTVISVEGVSKMYRLGEVGTGTFYGDIKRWSARRRGLPDPFLKIGESNSKTRDGEILWALKDVSFSVKQGEAVGIIGKNGAGKSTLLKILSRLTAPTEGEVKLAGGIASLLEVGTGFHPELTGRENIFLNSAILGMDRRETQRKFDEIVEFSGIEKFIDTPVKHYSSGMYVRLAFAVAAHLEPEILILDEVLAVGDAEFQKKCLGKMGDVAHDGRTVLFVSHNMTAIQRLCPRSIWLERGRIRDMGDTSKVLEGYHHSLKRLNEGIDIANIPRREGVGVIARIVDCFLLDQDKNKRDTLKFGEPFGIGLKFSASQPFTGVSIVIGIDTSQDNRITTILSEHESAFFNLSPENVLSTHAFLPNLRLRPGTYYLTLGIRHGRVTLDHVVNAVKFKVIDVSTDEKSQESFIQGHIHTPALWS